MKRRIVFTGGGTLGSVTPLIAVYEELIGRRDDGVEVQWIGTYHGPERAVVEKAGMQYRAISSGKLRRYFSLQTVIDPLFIFIGFLQSLIYFISWRPSVVVSAGSFVAVPVMYAARLLGVKSVVLQLDLDPGLANKLTAGGASKILVALPEEAQYFSRDKVSVVGIPVRKIVAEVSGLSSSAQVGLKRKLGLPVNIPMILVLGGGTGSQAINEIISDALPDLVKDLSVVHVTGLGKEGVSSEMKERYGERYFPFDFLQDELIDYMACAELVVTRAGMGTLAELCVMGKKTIVIPIPNSHQEINAEYFRKRGAVVYLRQDSLSGEVLARSIIELLKDRKGDFMIRAMRQIFPVSSANTVANAIDMVLRGK